jgi:transposase
MTEQELAKRSNAELIEIILSLNAENEQLKRRLAEMEKQQQQPAKTPQNSSVPPAAGQKANRKKTKKQRSKSKRGAKPGHKGQSRRRTKPDVVIECQLDKCPDCDADLSEVEQKLIGRSQVVEIPPIQPVVVEAERYGCWCPECRTFQKADYPSGMEAERVFGARLEAIVSYLHQIHHLSYLRLQTVLALLFGLMISLGALTNLVQRTARRLKPAAEAIREEIQHSQVVQSDETGARVDGQNHWQWTFVTDTATYHVIAASRGSGIIEEVMDQAVPLVWVSDLWSAQGKAKSKYRQICQAHQLRDLQYAIDAERSAWAYQMQRLLLRSQRLAKAREQLSIIRYRLAVAQLEADCDTLLAQSLLTPEAQRLQRRYLKHRASLFVFLYHHNVPFDNNASERALRNSVIHRKVSGGFRSEDGAQAHAIISSVADTARKRDQDILAVLQEYIGQPAPTSC